MKKRIILIIVSTLLLSAFIIYQIYETNNKISSFEKEAKAITK